jgi:hypothetical protein
MLAFAGMTNVGAGFYVIPAVFKLESSGAAGLRPV